ncbi:MAG: ferritin-like domain-containing protein [Leptospiraceae bacterium]|nr:ferritin-like domain-containing protein [Leptospiraceae bacterium]MCP5497557.1 ferritin-like domain-containing protein [Leptospiraceae bacterium]
MKTQRLFEKNIIQDFFGNPKTITNKSSNAWKKWLEYFSENAKRSIPEPFFMPLPYRPRKVNVLLRSLAIFQLGETGEGRIVKEIQKKHLRGTDKNFNQCISYFIKEEGRHARLLGLCIQSLNGKLLSKNWSATLFTKLRRLIGIRAKLFMLAVAEVIGFSFYSSFYNRLPKSHLSCILSEIAKDEEKHLLFHAEFFQNHFRSRYFKKLFLLIWCMAVSVVVELVLWNHRKTFSEFGISRQFYLGKVSSHTQIFADILMSEGKSIHPIFKEVNV